MKCVVVKGPQEVLTKAARKRIKELKRKKEQRDAMTRKDLGENPFKKLWKGGVTCQA